LTISPPITALAVGLPAQRAIAQRFCALALFCRADRASQCLFMNENRKTYARFELDPTATSSTVCLQ
jgi:hypothetical protein